ncbi:MAG: hypothetical protein HOH79_02280 [Euryarchaeota archaeon]|jgi:hypothetical protein|nr:hypothetical protein [Euryarchaeota archaeon]HJL97170.1 hypothetical protein [Candidatus Poseidoniaceae archaeon]MBT5843794.1 hypothetical protein [Euryarchaeota archaeon]MBT6640621.1 hypothetical protein [Euryarchaeota archaeon]MBT6845079.1 hypothetical protein [Euryarchaeota archaeon]
MMEWRPKGYEFNAKNLVRALFSEHTDEGKLLEAAACGYVEIFARSNAWNGVLWLIMSTLKEEGKPIYNGEELKALRESLPIVWR